MAMKANVYITLKHGVLDPQGKATQGALAHLGFGGVQDVKIGKFIEVTLAANDAIAAKAEVEAMCKKLLANTVVENYRFELQDVK